jgi:hypothetical protein
VTDTFVASNFDLATNVGGNFTAEVTLNAEVSFEVVTQSNELLVGQVLDADVSADLRVFERLECSGTANAVDVGECDFHALFAGNVYSGKTCHGGFSCR